MKVLVGAFNQEKALIGAFSVIVQLRRLIVYSTSYKSVAVSPSHQSESDSTMNTSSEAGGEAGLLGLYTHYLVELRDPR